MATNRKRTCAVPDCDMSPQYRKLCYPHLSADPDAQRCEHVGCGNACVSGGYCPTHASQLRREGTTWDVTTEHHIKGKACIGPLCDRPAVHRDGHCKTHWEQSRKHGYTWVIGAPRLGRQKRNECRICGSPDVQIWGMCLAHAVEANGVCWLPGCTQPASHKRSGLCETDRRRERSMVFSYGIGWQERQKIAESQGHACAICGKPDDPVSDALHIDHDHATGFVRGLLCGSCNRAIGLLRHDSKALWSAILYLQG